MKTVYNGIYCINEYFQISQFNKLRVLLIQVVSSLFATSTSFLSFLLSKMAWISSSVLPLVSGRQKYTNTVPTKPIVP